MSSVVQPDLGLLGLGPMGEPMARRLLDRGPLTVWNRTREKAEALAADGATVARNPAEAAHDAEAVVTALADGPAVERAMAGEDGALDGLPDAALWVQMSTVAIGWTERLGARAEERGLLFVDAPVLGSKPQAEEGSLLVLASGPEPARDRAAPVFDAVGRRTLWLGPAGAGTRLKLVANHWVLCALEGIAQTFAFARALGVDPRRFLEAIEGGAMDMPYVHLKGEAMLAENFPPAFSLRLARKDLALILEGAAGALDLPLARATLAQFERAIELGHGDEDMAATYYAGIR